MTNSIDTAQNKNRRRRKFILRGLQLKIALQTLFVAVPLLLLNFLLAYNGALKYLQRASDSARAASIPVSGIIFNTFLTVLAIAIPFAIGVGILYSFTFCGPIYRFNKYFTELFSGRWDRPCTLRKGDQLQDVKETINGAIRLLTGRIYSQYELLRDLRGILADPARSAERVREAIEMIDAEQVQVAPRFGEAKLPAPAATVDEKNRNEDIAMAR